MARRIELKKEEKKQGLLDAAHLLFTEKGIAKTSIDEIVRQANVAKGTFYLYFKDKNDILQTLTYSICSRVLDEAYRAVSQHRSDDFTENVLALLDYIIEYFKRNKLQLRLIERNFTWPMQVTLKLSERTDPLWLDLIRNLENSPLAQKYTQEELFRRIYVILELCGSICYSSIIEGKPAPIDDMKPTLYDIVRRSLG